MKRVTFHLTIVLTLGLGLTLALLWLLGGGGTPVVAAPGGRAPAVPQGAGDVFCVTAISAPYAGCTQVFTNVQAAVDTSSGGEVVKVASGTYTDVHSSIIGMQVITQVVEIDKSVTIRGGYTTTNGFADPSDPDKYPATLDAGRQGRPVVVLGQASAPITVTLEGLRLTNGSATVSGLSGQGGGIFARYAHLVLSGCHVFTNTAVGDGGGVFLTHGDGSTLVGNQVYSNTAASDGGGINVLDSPDTALARNDVFGNVSGTGGGVYLSSSPNARLSSNQIYSNTVQGGSGGGIVVSTGPGSTLEGNHVYSNTATSDGGGVLLFACDNCTLEGNHVSRNTLAGGGTLGRQGAGVYAESTSNATLRGNSVRSNTVTASTFAEGGGIHLRNSSTIVLTDNEVTSNTASGSSAVGGGIHVYSSTGIVLAGTRIVSNTASGSAASGGGIHAQHSPDLSLTGNDVRHNAATLEGGGLRVENSDRPTMIGNVFYDNAADFGGGLHLEDSDEATLHNNMVVENHQSESGRGAGMYLERSDARLLHTTVARNTGGEHPDGVSVAGCTVWMTNTILVDHYTGIEYGGAATAVTVTYTLWGTGTWANYRDWHSTPETGTIYTGTLATNWWELPGFVDPGGGDYHIGTGSGAIDKGLSTDLDTDVDGDDRPTCGGPDLGADEYACCARIGSTYYPTVQDAVDAADDGNLIEVAGTCQGVGSQSAVAYITESVTIRGGYAGDFSDWDPHSYPATLDALGQGRVIFVDGVASAGDITPTLEALRLTNGSTNDPGGGIYVEDISDRRVHPVISGCQIYGNTAGIGGGIALYYTSDARLTGSTVFSNTAGGSPAVGGGVFLHYAINAAFVNNMVVDNRLALGSACGAGINLNTSDARFLHTTIARNSGGGGQGVCVVGSSTAALTNTILVSHTVGILATAPVTMTATLWGEGPWLNETPTVGSVSTGTLNYSGYPDFVRPDSGDYHIGKDSAAIGKGVSAGVDVDIDGDPRFGAPDLGADEVESNVYLPLVLRSY